MEKAIELIKSSGNKWVLDNIILFVRSGSRAYGLASEESDYDYKAICIPPVEYHLGLKNFKTMHLSTGDNDSKNASDDIDVSIYSLQEFARLASKGNPNVLELLYVDMDDILYATHEGQQLGLNRGLFLSNKIENSFGGYAMSSMKYLERALGVEEDEASKKIQNALRVYDMGIEAFYQGGFSTKRPNRDYLLKVRNGLHSAEQGKEVLNRKEKQFKEARKTSILPENVNTSDIDDLLIKLTMNHLGLVKKSDYFRASF